MAQYPIYPNSGPGAPECEEGTPGSAKAVFSTKNPYPLHGNQGMQQLPTESTLGTKHAGGAGQYSNPYPVHGLQYAIDKAMTAPKNVTHSQSGDIRHADDMSGGNPIERKTIGGQVGAVSAALDARLNSRKPMAESQDQKNSFKQAAKGAKAGRPAKDMKLRHAGTQADVNTASTGY